jgi:gas vesicle protein
LLPQGVRSSIIVGLIIGAVLAAIAAYFLPERETTITRNAAAEEIRENVSVVRPWVNELKDLKELKELKELRK